MRGDAAQKVNRAYGTTGIITALEMPLAPAWPWIDVIVTFDDFFEAMRFGYEVALADGVVKKLLTPMIWPIPMNFPPLRPHIPDGKNVLFAMIAEPSLETFKAILGRRGTITYEVAHDDSPNVVPLYEYTWNHTTLQWLKQDRTITYLQCLFPADRVIESVREMWALFPDEVLPHTEFIRFGGRVTCSALPIVRYRGAERLNEIIALHEQHGVMIANPHVYTLEDGSRHKRADADQAGYKAEVDPFGLLNPGKMRSYVPVQHLTMRVLYLYCHPLPESFHAAIRERALAGLAAARHEVDLLDLYAEKFDPVMSEAARRDYHDTSRNQAGLEGYVARLRAARRARRAVSGLEFWHARHAQGLLRSHDDARCGIRSVRSGTRQADARQSAAHRRDRDLWPTMDASIRRRRSAAQDGQALFAVVCQWSRAGGLLRALSYEYRQ